MSERTPQNLRELLAGIDVDVFFDEVWGNSVRVVKGERGRFLGLCSLAELPSILAKTAPRLSNVHASRDGQVDESVWIELSSRLQRGESLDAGALARLCGDATLVVNGLDAHHEPAMALARMLFSALGEHVGVNAYLSPAGGGLGLGYHYDCWDIFVLQVEGEKRWQLYDARAPYPIERMQLHQARAPQGEPTQDIMLRAGDLLYMPRGTWHRPHPTDIASLHLTVGIHSKLPLDLTNWILEELKHDPDLRRDLPLSREGHSREALQVEALHRAAAKMRDLLSQPDVAQRFLTYRFMLETSMMWPEAALPAADPLTAQAYRKHDS